jgi:hypothetical protein
MSNGPTRGWLRDTLAPASCRRGRSPGKHQRSEDDPTSVLVKTPGSAGAAMQVQQCGVDLQMLQVQFREGPLKREPPGSICFRNS